MVLHQEVGELLGELLQDVRVAIGDMRDEVDQVSEGNDTVIRGRSRRGHENFAMRLILVVLGAEIFDVRPEQVKALISIDIPQ